MNKLSLFIQLLTKKKTLVLAAFITLMLAACAAPNSSPEPTAQPIPTAPQPATAIIEDVVTTSDIPADLSFETLGELSYYGILEQPVTLVGGQFEGEPIIEGGASRTMVNLLSQPVAYGDLDNDGQPDAAVVLVSNSGGSGTFVYLALVQPRDGALENVATSFLGDRVQVKSLSIEGDRLIATLLSHAPDDPACCPSQEETRLFRLSGEQLIAADE